MTVPIKFYSTADEYGQFSNFAGYPIKIGKIWPTSEHYFQAMKFKDAGERERIRKANSPMQAARMGRDRKKRTLRKDWESARVNVMRLAVMEKFSQYEDLQELLLSTGDAKIIEHTANDDFWGDGGDGKGKNMLGQILMEVRQKLRDERASRLGLG